MKATLFTLAAIAGAASALDASVGDGDASVWEFLSDAAPRTVRPNNRPFKRQDGWNPPSELSVPLQEVWQHQLDTYSGGLFGFTNYGWDQLSATQG